MKLSSGLHKYHFDHNSSLCLLVNFIVFLFYSENIGNFYFCIIFDTFDLKLDCCVDNGFCIDCDICYVNY